MLKLVLCFDQLFILQGEFMIKILKTFVFCVLSFISLSVFAEEQGDGLFTVYFADPKTKNFSIQGYDIDYQTGEKGEDLSIRVGKKLAVFEEGTEELPGNGYRQIIRVVDPESYLSKVFKTRIINDSKVVRVIKAEETERTLMAEAYCEDPENSGWRHYWLLKIKGRLHLEDGSVLEVIGRTEAEKSEAGKRELEELSRTLSFEKVDQVRINSEKTASIREAMLDFQEKRFSIHLLAKDQIFGPYAAKSYARKSKPILTTDQKLYEVYFVAPVYSMGRRPVMQLNGLSGKYKLYAGSEEEVMKLNISFIRDEKNKLVKTISHSLEFQGLHILDENTQTYLYVFTDPSTGQEFSFTFVQPVYPRIDHFSS